MHEGNEMFQELGRLIDNELNYLASSMGDLFTGCDPNEPCHCQNQSKGGCYGQNQVIEASVNTKPWLLNEQDQKRIMQTVARTGLYLLEEHSRQQ